VIREFKRTKRITEPAADELAGGFRERVDDLFDQEAGFSYKEYKIARLCLQSCIRPQPESAEAFLQEIVAWQQMRS